MSHMTIEDILCEADEHRLQAEQGNEPTAVSESLLRAIDCRLQALILLAQNAAARRPSGE